jgi:FHA domain/Protein of unknown function (DUF3662)
LSILDKVRKWVDGDGGEDILEKAAAQAKNRPVNSAEEFIVKLARAVEDVMQKEMVSLPQGTTLIPPEYTIFLSSDDDKEWQGAKRRGLEQGLYHVLAERAQELSGKKKLDTRSFSVELRIDGTLEKGEIRISHSWDDAESGKTSVLSRTSLKGTPADPAAATNIDAAVTQPNFVATTANNAAPVTPNSAATSVEADESTVVQKRNVELYKLEVWRGGVKQNTVPVYSHEVTIGRGSQSKPVDIPLKGDPEISRKHITLTRDASGNYWLSHEGRNATFISGREMQPGQKLPVSPGENINVCTYMLRII